MDIRPELFEGINEKFTEHLSFPSNERILFSGAFGVGKTTFLKHYFEQREVKKQYNVFNLYPVNYSVLRNEDIFKYIKCDILFELIEKEYLNLGKNAVRKTIKDLGVYIGGNFDRITGSLLLLIPKVGKQLNKLAEDLRHLNNDFNQYLDDKRKHEASIADLLNSANKNEGDLYEFNFLTQIISDVLEEIKIANIDVTKENPKKNILIIDDLDRIDPEHIFRIFNVFSAHFDKSRGKEENKFGFDHIVLVCDYKNIKNIFHHKYGSDTDYNGYIDKFYSKELFQFDNYVNTATIIEGVLDSIQFKGVNQKHTEYLNSVFFLRDYAVVLLQFIILNKGTTIRNIVRHYQSTLILKSKDLVDRSNRSKIPLTSNNCLNLLTILNAFFLDFSSFTLEIERLEKSSLSALDNSRLLDYNQLLGELLVVLNLVDSKEEITTTNLLTFDDLQNNITYDIKSKGYNKQGGRFYYVEGPPKEITGKLCLEYLVRLLKNDKIEAMFS